MFQIFLYLFWVYFLACSKVSGNYFFSPKTTDRPSAREDKHQSSVAKPSTFFTKSTTQPYQSTDGSHGKLAFSFAVYRFSITRFKTQQLMFFSKFPPSSKKAYCVFHWKYLAIFSDHFTFLGNCPPTPPLSQRFALSEKP